MVRLGNAHIVLGDARGEVISLHELHESPRPVNDLVVIRVRARVRVRIGSGSGLGLGLGLGLG